MTIRTTSFLFLAATVLGAVATFTAQPASASESFGSNDNPASDCRYSSVTAQIQATGAVIYDVFGNCGGAPIGGKLMYDQHTQRFSEVFFNSVKFEAIGSCPADPWTRGAVCTGQKVSAQGNDPNQILASLNPALAPFSLQVQAAAQLFQRAYASAVRPNPPSAPVNGSAQTTVLWREVRVRWLAPDESGNRPFVEFNVQARPQGASGAAWSTVGNVPRQGNSYDVSLRMPPMIAGYTGWDVRACSVTAFTQTCTSPLATDVSSNALARQPYSKPQTPVTGVTVQTGAGAVGSFNASAAAVTPNPVAPNPVLTSPVVQPSLAPQAPNAAFGRPVSAVPLAPSTAPVAPSTAPSPILTRPQTQSPIYSQPPRAVAPPSALRPPGT
jgi:hypothetical protein